MIYKDRDGSITGTPNTLVVHSDNITLSDSRCVGGAAYSEGLVCKNMANWIRFALNRFSPELAVIFNVTNKFDQKSTSYKIQKRLTHPSGFMFAVEANQEYKFTFDGAERPTNMSYIGTFYNIKPNDYIIVKHDLFRKPDLVTLFSKDISESKSPLSPVYSNQGDWYWDNSTYTLNYILLNKNTLPFLDVPVTFSALKCRFAGCKPPTSPALRAPVKSRPADALYWSNISTWAAISEPGWGGFLGNNQFALPKTNDSVRIIDGKYIVVDCPLPKLKYLYIEGILELDNGIDHKLEAEMIFINGGQLIVGWENDPILTNVEIVLHGVKDSLNFRLPDGINLIGGKGIGVFGGLDLHGKTRNDSFLQFIKKIIFWINILHLKTIYNHQK